MDWWDKKVLKYAYRLASLIILVIVTYALYSYYKIVNLSNYEMQNQYASSNYTDSVNLSKIRASSAEETDSIKSLPDKDSQSSLYTSISSYHKQDNSFKSVTATVQERSNTRINSHPEKNDSFASVPAAAQEKNTDESHSVHAKTTTVLHGPTADFSRECKIAVGKTIPVNILWADPGATPMYFTLVSIKVDDITGKKARFTVEDPFAVLLFSQTGYAANEKIIIEDERHNINISVLQVNINFVIIKITSRLNESIVSKLRKV